MSIQLHVGAATDVGQVRTVNEDSFLIDTSVAAVADGMGGHRGGAVASRIAVETLWDHFTLGSLESLVAGVVNANAQIIGEASAAPELLGMGTTMCALGVVTSDGTERVGIVNVGDSRVYRIHDGQMEQITVDHSLVESMVREGRLTPAEAEVHPQRNIVTRALGANPQVEVDEFLLEPVTGDCYLLCSDGLSNEVSDQDIARIIGESADPQAGADALVAAANTSGGRDNITCVIVRISVDDQPESRPGSGQAPDAQSPTFAPAASTIAAAGDTAPPPAPRWRWWKRG